MSSKRNQADAACIDFREIRDGYDRRISSMNKIEDQLEEMISIGIKHLKNDLTEDEIINLAITSYPHNLDDETPEGDDMQVLQSSFIFVMTELCGAIRDNELRIDDGIFPYRAFTFSPTRESVTFYLTGEAAGL